MHQDDPTSGERSGLDGCETARSFRGDAERSGSEPLLGRTQLHVSGYGGRAGEPRTSSDEREDAGINGSGIDRTEVARGAGVDARQSPFYDWLEHSTIRELVHRCLELSVGERLILLKGLVPGLVDAMGLAEFDGVLAEIGVKAHRFQEATDHPGEGRLFRVTPGEQIGGPVPTGHHHLLSPREPKQRGAREAERALEGELWARTEDLPLPDQR